jgi:hypothetical protein
VVRFVVVALFATAVAAGDPPQPVSSSAISPSPARAPAPRAQAERRQRAYDCESVVAWRTIPLAD